MALSQAPWAKQVEAITEVTQQLENVASLRQALANGERTQTSLTVTEREGTSDKSTPMPNQLNSNSGLKVVVTFAVLCAGLHQESAWKTQLMLMSQVRSWQPWLHCFFFFPHSLNHGGASRLSFSQCSFQKVPEPWIRHEIPSKPSQPQLLKKFSRVGRVAVGNARAPRWWKKYASTLFQMRCQACTCVAAALPLFLSSLLCAK